MDRRWAVTGIRRRKHLIGSVYVLRAEKHGVSEHWAAATLEAKAVAAVERKLGQGWIVTLTDGRLTSRLSALKMRPNTVQKLGVLSKENCANAKVDLS